VVGVVRTQEEARKVAKTIAILSRHDYWNRELWRERVPKHSDDDKADVQNAVLLKMLSDIGIYAMPFGDSWAHICKDDELPKIYLSRYNDIFDDYRKWCIKQR